MKFDNNGNVITSFGSGGIQQTIYDIASKYCLSMSIK
jgi:hypothetical protein